MAGASHVALVVKNPPPNAGDTRDLGSTPGPGKGVGNGNPLQYPCLENPMDRGAWWAIAQGPQRIRHNRVTEHTQDVYMAESLHLKLSQNC